MFLKGLVFDICMAALPVLAQDVLIMGFAHVRPASIILLFPPGCIDEPSLAMAAPAEIFRVGPHIPDFKSA